METLKVCPVCGSNNFSNYLNCIDYTVSKETHTIVTCNACTFKFTNPRPEESVISKYYQSEDYISHSNSSKGLFNKLYQNVRNYTISLKKDMIVKHVSRGTLLDIGCGTGEFLNYMNKNGWETKGVEPGADARNYAISVYGLNVGNEDSIKEIKDESISVITMWHVLEHVHDLNNRLIELKRLIKKDGVIIIAVPNYTSYDAKKYKKFWAAYDLPRHLYHFSPNTITQLFSNHGLRKIETRPMKFDSYYVSMLSEKYKSGRIKYLNAILVGFISNWRSRLKNNNTYSSQIYMFVKE
jgi:SAM-dependent methyltransferase